MFKKINYAYLIFTIFIFFILFSFYFILNTNENTKNNYITLEKLELLNLLDKKFDTVLSKKLQYINIDDIAIDIDKFNQELYIIKNISSSENLNKSFINNYQNLLNNFIKKRDIIQEFKKYNALLIISMQKLLNIQAYVQKRYYFNPIGLEVNTIIVNFTQAALGKYEYVNYINQNIKTLKQLNNLNNLADKQLNNFINDAQVALQYLNNLNKAVKKTDTIYLNKSIHILKKDFIAHYEIVYNKEKNFSYLLLFIIMSFLIILIVIYVKDKKHKLELLRFRKAVEGSDNSVIITDMKKNITYVNDAFVKNTGYTFNEVVGKNPRILKSDDLYHKYYDDIYHSLENLKSWKGEFVNRKKNGEIFYEKASITPIIMDDEVTGYLAIKLDITDYVNQQNQLLEQINNIQLLEKENKEKEAMMFQQSKMASLGEMFENIAHQWRQPLSVISTSASGMKLQKEFGILTDDMFNDHAEKIVTTTEHMSKTIDDFRNFFKKDKVKRTINLKNSINNTLSLLTSKFKNRGIDIIENMNEIQILALEGELVQSFMNIFTNAQDAFEDLKTKDKFIFIDIIKENNFAIIKIQDTAGGIPKDVIDNIFEPYFTTKHKSNGTGIGLYMTYEIIVKHHKGTIEVENHTFKYKDIEYTGALFTIKLPIEIIEDIKKKD
ncbi:MAG: hypothetical protein DRG78_08345 [Epsilonproteobacteria bacterium]|nr:MAG: hypothetical protein DRG78_08345 [Campylobacterota bacterium]